MVQDWIVMSSYEDYYGSRLEGVVRGTPEQVCAYIQTIMAKQCNANKQLIDNEHGVCVVDTVVDGVYYVNVVLPDGTFREVGDFVFYPLEIKEL